MEVGTQEETTEGDLGVTVQDEAPRPRLTSPGSDWLRYSGVHELDPELRDSESRIL